MTMCINVDKYVSTTTYQAILNQYKLTSDCMKNLYNEWSAQTGQVKLDVKLCVCSSYPGFIAYYHHADSRIVILGQRDIVLDSRTISLIPFY